MAQRSLTSIFYVHPVLEFLINLQSKLIKGGFVNLFLLICMKDFQFTIFEYPGVYPFQKI